MKPQAIVRHMFAWSAFLAVIAFLIPKLVMVRSDDFGYIESAAETIQSGRLTQSEWLGPFNVPLPLLSAGVFALTGNFWVATLGVIAALAATNFLLLRVWLRTNGVDGDVAALALALCPWWLSKAVEYTGVAFGLSMLLGALIAWRRGSRLVFFCVLLLGVANRQSIVCLIAFPACALARVWWQQRKIDPVLAIGTLVVVGLAAGLELLLPATFARQWVSAQARASFSPIHFAENMVLAAAIFAGLRAGWRFLSGESLIDEFRANIVKPLLPLALCLASAWIAVRGSSVIAAETPGLDRVGPLMVVAATFAGAWLNRWRPLPPVEIMLYLGLYAALVAMRGQWWDYYFLEPAIVLVGADSVNAVSSPRRGHWVGWTLLLVIDLAYAAKLHGWLRSSEATLVANERGLRAGTLRMAEVSEGSFGYLGWKLFAVAQQRGLSGARLPDFLKYVEAGRTRTVDGVVMVNRKGLGRSLHPSGELWPLPENWRDRRFPLTNAEWVDFLSTLPTRNDARSDKQTNADEPVMKPAGR
jgi:hypothetical protein